MEQTETTIEKQKPRRNNIAFVILVVMAIAALAKYHSISPRDLRCEHLPDPLGIEQTQPRLSWQAYNSGHKKELQQTAYQILAASTPDLLDEDAADLWNSGVVNSSASQLIPYGGKALTSGSQCYWTVRVYNQNNRPSSWSKTARFSVGLLDSADWRGNWIAHPYPARNQHIWLRKSLKINDLAQSAMIYVASLGYHELYVNGKKADDRVLAPVQTRLDKRVLYVTYDIADLLKKGDNVIALWYAPGWTNYTEWSDARRFQPTVNPALLVQLYGTTKRGDAIEMHSDADWRCAESYSRHNGPFRIFNMGGESMDGRQYNDKWNTLKFVDNQWITASVVQPARKGGKIILSAHNTDAAYIVQTIKAQRAEETAPPATRDGKGKWKVTMDKTFTGFWEIKFRGLKAGDTVFFSVSDNPDTVDTYHQDYYYIARGENGETFRSRFNYSAGRYVYFSGLPAKPRLSDVKGYAVTCTPPPTSTFECSSELLNKIYATDLWTFQMCTIEGYTTDCPNRERLGYGSEGAFQTMWGGGLLNFPTAAFYKKWVRDWSDVQQPSGELLFVAPQLTWTYGSPLYCIANMNVATEHFLTYGDTTILQEAYGAGKRWVDFLIRHSGDGLLKQYVDSPEMFLGDWLSPGARKEYGNTEQALFFGDCVYVMSIQLAADVADILGYGDEAAAYRARIAPLKEKVHNAYYKPALRSYANGDQVRTSLALFADVVPDTLRAAVVAHLKEDMTGAHPYFDIGSPSRYPFFKTMLAYPDVFAQTVADILLKTDYPSYGYFIEKGETTFPEAWEAKGDAHVHTSYVGITAWLIKGLAGIEPAEAGYRTVNLRPRPVAQLDYAKAAVQSPYGMIESGWKRDADKVIYNFIIPIGVQANIFLPAEGGDYQQHTVAAGRHQFEVTTKL